MFWYPFAKSKNDITANAVALSHLVDIEDQRKKV